MKINRLVRAEKGLPYPLHKEAQEKRIMDEIIANLRTSRHFHNPALETKKEWERLRTSSSFKNGADPYLVLDLDLFIEEFGLCPRKGYRLRKVAKHLQYWTKHTCAWSKFYKRRGNSFTEAKGEEHYERVPSHLGN